MCPAFLSDGSRQYNRAHKIHPRDSVSQLGYYLSPTTPSSSDSACGHSQEVEVRPGKKRKKCDYDFNEEAIDCYPASGASRASSGWFKGTFRTSWPRSGDEGATSSVSSSSPRVIRANGGTSVETSVSNEQSSDDEHTWFKLRKRKPIKRLTAEQVSATGMSSLSDDANTQIGPTLLENHLRPAYQINLKDANHGRRWVPSGSSLIQSSLAGSTFVNSDGQLNTLGQMAKGGNESRVSFGYTAGGSSLVRSARLANSHLEKPSLALIGAQTNPIRVKRRNMGRANRRMLIGGFDHLVNPYALSELFSQSEIPGFREIFASDSYLRKFCWIVAFLFMTVLSLNDITELITEYYEYPITVDLRLRDSARLPFPSVTVCNLNVVRFSALCSFSSSNSQNPLFKIPSDLRDKLCGIQVDNKNRTGGTDSDINDINNIGIVTTTSKPASTSSTVAADASTISDSNSMISSQSASTTSSLPGLTATMQTMLGATLQAGSTDPMLPSLSRGTTISSNKWSTRQVADQTNRPSTATSGDDRTGQAEHKLLTMTSTQGAISSSVVSSSPPPPSTGSTRSNGALDLGDFTDPSLLLMDSRRAGRLVGGHSRGRRSFRLAENSGESWNEAKQRPFAPSKSRIRVGYKPSSGGSTPIRHVSLSGAEVHMAAAGGPKLHHQVSQIGGQLMQLGVQASRVGTGAQSYSAPPPGILPAVHGANRNGVPVNHLSAVTALKSFQNPLMSTTPISPSTIIGSTTPASGAFVPAALPEDFELTERQERELQENLTNWLAVMQNRDPELTWTLGHQFDDMILRCTMKSINCTHQRSFENSFTPTEGNCFTYRSKIRRRISTGVGGNTQRTSGGSSQFEEANLASINHGLELVLNLEKNEYVSGSSQVGALVMVHHPNDLGYAASEATFVAPEFTTYIGLKMVNITRLPAPYPEYCVDSWPKLFAETLTRNSTYSQQACLRICLQTTIQSHCHCQSAFLPIVELDNGGSANTQANQHQQVAATTTAASQPGSSNSSASNSRLASEQVAGEQPQRTVIICDTRKLATRQCVREVMLRAADRVHNCECPPKCQVVRYDKTISMARWPTREDRVTFDRGKMDVNFQNLAKVIVYFQTMTCDEVTQQAVFNAAKLFSALGGIMGMYVGFSFLSVFEIFEVMSRKMWHHFSSKIANTRSRLASNRLNA